jgi:methionyl-tRNA formyltransferase
VKTVSALFLASPTPLSMGTMSRWLQAGHRVTSVWYPDRAARNGSLDADRRMAAEMPLLSMHAISQYYELDCHPVKRLSTDPELIARVKAQEADVIISDMFMDYIPSEMLSAFAGRVLNLHPSLLPAYRGPSPILGMLWERTIDRFSGLTLHAVTERVDEGPIISQRAVSFPDSRNLGIYLGMMIDAAGDLLCKSIPRYLDGELPPVPQDASTGSYCKLSAANLTILRHFSVDHVNWLCSTIGQFTSFRVTGLPDLVRVNRLTKVLGRPTGAPDRLEDLYAELDLADGRVHLGRSGTMPHQQLF